MCDDKMLADPPDKIVDENCDDFTFHAYNYICIVYYISKINIINIIIRIVHRNII